MSKTDITSDLELKKGIRLFLETAPDIYMAGVSIDTVIFGFHNDKLKAPSQLNVIDNELNKNISLGHKKKSHPHKQTHQARQATPDAKPHSQAASTKNQQQVKPQFNTTKTQVKIELPVKAVGKQEQPVKKEEAVKKPQVQAPKVAQVPKVVVDQAPVVKKVEKLVVPQVAVMKKTEEVITSQPLVAMPAATAPRVVTKLKRRPLAGTDQGVSGITRSSTESPSGITRSGLGSSGITRSTTKVVESAIEKLDFTFDFDKASQSLQKVSDVAKSFEFAQGSTQGHVGDGKASDSSQVPVITTVDKGDQE